MMSRLLLVELSVNRSLILLAVVGNLFLYVMFVTNELSYIDFLNISAILYYTLVVLLLVRMRDEKRQLLYLQLPVSIGQIFVASWLVVLVLLIIHATFWVGFSLSQDNESGQTKQILDGFLAIMGTVALANIALSLKYFKPYFLRWIYVFVVAAIIITLIGVDFAVQEQGREVSRLMPFNLYLWNFGMATSVILLLFLATLIIVDYLVYTRSDNYIE